MEKGFLIARLSELETRLRFLDGEVQRLRDENTQLKAKVKELESALENKANSKASKKPKFSLNYGVDRNKPKENSQKSKRQRRKRSTGRVPNDQKIEKADCIIDLFPKGARKSKCILRREQFVWRLIDGKAKFVHYRIHAKSDDKRLPEISGVRNTRSEFGIELILSVAFLVYWIGLSMDKVCSIFEFFTGLKLSKGQADSLLNQLASDWQTEYETIAALIVKAAILYVDETGWKIGKKSCYTWIFSTLGEVFYKCGVGRGKDVLVEVLGEQFPGIGVSDDYAPYDSAFAEHQLCWAHPLRKALELSLRNPENQGYKRFMQSLFNIYYDAVRLSKDKRLTIGREEKVKQLQSRLRRICRRFDETVVTSKMVENSKKSDPNSQLEMTSECESKMIHLQKQLHEKCVNMFVFVLHPEVEPTNNRSERQARPESLARKSSRTSKSANGAKRRGIIMTVLASLEKRLECFTLKNIVDTVSQSLAAGIAIFSPIPIKNSE